MENAEFEDVRTWTRVESRDGWVLKICPSCGKVVLLALTHQSWHRTQGAT